MNAPVTTLSSSKDSENTGRTLAAMYQRGSGDAQNGTAMASNYQQTKSSEHAQRTKMQYDGFMKMLHEFMRLRQTPITEVPNIAGKPVNLFALYGFVLKAGGSEFLDNNRLWIKIAGLLGFPDEDLRIAETFRRFLAPYEQDWLAKRARSDNVNRGSPHTSRPVSKTKVSSSEPLKNDRSEASTAKSVISMPHGSPSGGTIKVESDSVSLAHEPGDSSVAHKGVNGDNEDSSTKDDLYRPLKRKFDTYSGHDIHVLSEMGHELHKLKPLPIFQELGKVDIHALSKSIQSGLPSEVGHALDVLVVIAGDRRWGLPLVHCGDLLDAMLECLSSDLKWLRPARTPTATFTPYTQLLHDLRRENLRLRRDFVHIGARECDHMVALQRISSILTILRNLAYTDINQEIVARSSGTSGVLALAIQTFCSEPVSARISGLQRLEFMKDMITLLSLITPALIIRDQETMSVFVGFVLSFEPSDALENPATKPITRFSGHLDNSYQFSAVDTLAKLLARDATNRQVLDDLLKIRNQTTNVAILSRIMSLALGALPLLEDHDPSSTIRNRLPLLHHAVIIADAASDFCPAGGELVRQWLHAETLLLPRLENLVKQLSAMSHPQSARFQQDAAVLIRRVMNLLGTLLRKANYRNSEYSSSLARAEYLVVVCETGLGLDCSDL